MTFTEAAAQVLRLVGKPLHYKEITDVAIEKNLLSHVGKSPEVTMGARLAALVKKGDRENPLVRLKPGVFALREWNQATIDAGLADRTPALARIAASDSGSAGASNGGGAHSAFGADAEASTDSVEGDASGNGWDEEKLTPMDPEEQRRAALAAQARELFQEEADDEEPIFGGSDAPAPVAATTEGDSGAQGGRRRRRRGRRGRGGDFSDSGGDLPGYTVSDAEAGAPADAATLAGEGEFDLPEFEVEDAEPVARESGERESALRSEAPRGGGGGGGGRNDFQARGDRDRGDRSAGRDRGRDDRGRDDRARDDRGRDDRGRDDRARDDRGRDRSERRAEGEPRHADDLSAKEVASVLEELFTGYDKNRGPVSAQSLCDAAQRRGYLIGEGLSPGLFLSAARSDNQRAWLEGKRPRFRVIGGRILPTEWMLDGELLRLERELETLAGRYRDAARRGLARMLTDLPHRAVGDLVVLLLERIGFSEITRVRRQGSHGAELHLTAVQSSGPSGSGGVRTAIVIRRDGREIGREHVVELRGALHHYGSAQGIVQAGFLITTGQVLSGAREEAQASSATPVTLIDSSALAKLCEEHSVGVMSVRLNLPVPDAGLFDALRAAGG